MSKHTPGPWYSAGPNIRANTEEGDGALVAVVQRHQFAYGHLGSAVVGANASLIAAAPDMLAALQQFVDAFDKDLSAMLLAKLNAKAVIAKATSSDEKQAVTPSQLAELQALHAGLDALTEGK